MKAFLTYHLEAAICMGIFYMLYHLLLRKDTDHQYVRLYLLISLISSFLLPLADFQLFANPLEEMNPVILLEEFLVSDGAAANPAAITNAAKSIWSWQLCYLLVSGVLLIRLLWEFRKLYKLNDQHVPGAIEEYNGAKVVVHNGGLPTFSFMNTIYLSTSDLQPEAAKMKILAHEKSHIAGIHSFDRLLIELVRIACWFNPMIYLYKHALTLSHEYIADKESVNGGDQQQYVNLLVNQTLSNLGFSLGSHFGRKSGILSEWPLSFNKSQTLKRIKMIKNKRKSSKLKYIIPVLAVVLSIVVISCMEDEAIEPEVIIEEQAAEVPSKEPVIVNPVTINGPLFSIVEDKPVFPGGDAAMYKFLGKNIDYPQTARRMGLEGRVFVQFIVLQDGSLGNIQVLRGVSPDIDEEARRVVSSMPTWTSGKQRGRDVNVKMVLPIFFKIHTESAVGDTEVEVVEQESARDRLERIKAEIDDEAKQKKIELIIERLDQEASNVTEFELEVQKPQESMEEIVVTTYKN